jgi:signal peptidase I
MRHSKLTQVIVVLVLSLMFWPSICFGRMYHFSGHSMEPTLKNGQIFWCSKYSKDTNPARGDIIVFIAEKITFGKRIIGLPEEKVVVKNGIVYIINQTNPQGEKLDEPYLAPETVTEPDGEFLVPDGQYFVLGDNRGASRDSRQIGCIPRENVIGKVTKIF